MTKDKRINVRVDEDLYNQISVIADNLGINRSEVLRLSVQADLLKALDSPINKMGEETRKELMISAGNMSKDLQKLSKDFTWITNNVNQIARKANVNGITSSDLKDLSKFKKGVVVVNNEIKKVNLKVDKLWQYLV
ncbi:ribbon-helix-helix protein, CopG family [Facklamia sp. P9177]|uniref:ribbon-helix-helix protein, CopG family n=1 Tax=Facklamia sp. P9177 TaxID=3421945 RepID=UPI003D18695D